MTRATVLIPAHNEERFIRDCLRSLIDQSSPATFTIVVADRCTDRTVQIVQETLAGRQFIIIEKNRLQWKNSISESLQMGLEKATGDALVIVDADMVLPADFLGTLLPELEDFAVVSALVKTDPNGGTLNRLVSIWERSYVFAPMGEQPRGGARAIAIEPLKAIGGFHDVYAWESDLDNRLRRMGMKVKLDRNVSVLHKRKMTLTRSIAYQKQAGRARRELGVSPLRTILHSIIRLRPFVLVGYFRGRS